MAKLVGLPFLHSFTFTRSIAAPYRNAAGAIVSAPINIARFTHDAGGQRRGLIIEAGPVIGQHDAVQVIAGDWETDGPATVMMEWEDAAGLIRRRALYTRAVRQTVNAAMNLVGHLRLIIAVPGHLPNLGNATTPGYCRYRNTSWPLGASLSANNGRALASGGKPILESA